MTQQLGTIALQKNTKTFFKTPFTGLKALLITNLSGYSCSITMDGGNVSKTLVPGQMDWYPVNAGYTGTVLINPLVVIQNQTSWPSANISIDAVGLYDTENANMYPITVPIPAVTTTASGKPIFTCTVFFGTTATTIQALNIFNPANSGVNFTYHSCRVYTNSAAVGTFGTISYLAGPDNNIGAVQTITSHLAAKVPPVSLANATAIDSTTLPATFRIETYQTQTGVTLEILDFPDVVVQQPGTNILTTIVDATGGGNKTRLTLKWTEDQILS